MKTIKCSLCGSEISIKDQFHNDRLCPDCIAKGYWFDQYENLQYDRDWMSNEEMRKHGISFIDQS